MFLFQNVCHTKHLDNAGASIITDGRRHSPDHKQINLAGKSVVVRCGKQSIGMLRRQEPSIERTLS